MRFGLKIGCVWFSRIFRELTTLFYYVNVWPNKLTADGLMNVPRYRGNVSDVVEIMNLLLFKICKRN